MDPDAVLPPEVARGSASTCPRTSKLLSIFTDVFDCFFRFLAPILAARGRAGRGRLLAYGRRVRRATTRRAHPAPGRRFRRYDLFAPEFALSCLNRLQLRDNRQMVDLADPSAALQLRRHPDQPASPAHAPPR